MIPFKIGINQLIQTYQCNGCCQAVFSVYLNGYLAVLNPWDGVRHVTPLNALWRHAYISGLWIDQNDLVIIEQPLGQRHDLIGVMQKHDVMYEETNAP